MTADKDSLLREDEIERAYWRFDARRKGYSDWKGAPQSERDAFKAELRARITAALAEKDDGGWMPIETAPKDQKIMVACLDGSITAPAYWKKDEYAKKPRPYWTSYAECVWGKNAIRANQPTHWRPLPPLPKGE